MPVEHRTRALVLRTFDQGESDRLVHLFTADQGRVSAIAKGARRSRVRFPGALELFSVLDVRLVDPPRAALMRLEGARLVTSYEGLTADLGRYAIGCQLLELLDRLTGERQSNPDLLRFSLGVLETVASETPDRLLAVLMLAKTIARLGYRPELLRCTHCAEPLSAEGRVGFDPLQGGAVCARCLKARIEDGEPPPSVPARLLRALEAGIRTPLRERDALGLDASEVRRIEAMMRRFFQFHIGFELRTERFLQETLDSGRLDAGSKRRDTAPARTPRPPGADHPPDPERAP